MGNVLVLLGKEGGGVGWASGVMLGEKMMESGAPKYTTKSALYGAPKHQLNSTNSHLHNPHNQNKSKRFDTLYQTTDPIL